MFQASEVVNLILAAILTPMLWVGTRGITLAGKRWFVGSYAAMMCAYVFTVLEGYYLPDAFNLLEHVSLAASGLLAATGAYLLLRSTRQVEAQ